MQSSSPIQASGTNTVATIEENRVRRSLKPWSGVTFDLLCRLRASGCLAVPRPLERAPDADVYELIPGKVILRPWPSVFTASGTFPRDLGKALRLIHDVSRRLLKETAFGFPWGPSPPAPARAGEPEGEQQVICHGDLGPWNAVMDEEGGFRGLIDWDLARLGPPVEDLAEAAYEFGPLRLASQKQEGVFLPPELVRRRVSALWRATGRRSMISSEWPRTFRFIWRKGRRRSRGWRERGWSRFSPSTGAGWTRTCARRPPLYVPPETVFPERNCRTQ